GKLLWAYPHANKYSVHANTPIYHDGGIFFMSGYGKGSGKIALNEDGTEVSLAWNNPMDSRMGGAVLIDGYIYGSGDNNRSWRAINWETGENAYTSDAFGKGAVISADGKLFAYSDKGEIGLINVNSEKFDLLSKARVKKGSEQHWAHPIIHNGVLYVRHGKALIAYQVSSKK
nr:alcohol dehydrogenase [Bacteroidales bacterium]